MHIYDVEEAIDGADRTGLQHAFRVLISFPKLGHIEGVHSAPRLVRIFDDVISALQLDQAAMPEALLATLQALTSVTLEPQASYAQGAVIALEYRERWQQVFMAEWPGARLSAA